MYVKEWKALIKMALITCFLVCAQIISAQEKNISLELKNVTVKEALEQLKAKTTYSLWFNVSEVDLGRKITINFQDKSINEALNIILKGQALNYEIKDKYIQNKFFKSKNFHPMKPQFTLTKMPLLYLSH